MIRNRGQRRSRHSRLFRNVKMLRRLDDDEVDKIAPPILGDANSMARELTIIERNQLI